jgi:hypothetical protein
VTVEEERQGPYRRALPALRAVSTPGVPSLASIEFDRLLVQRLPPWSWWGFAAVGMMSMGLLVVGQATAGTFIVVVVMLLVGSLVPWSVTVGDDELLVVDDRVYNGESAQLAGKHALMPLPVATRRFAIAWQPAPMLTSIERRLSVRLRMDLRIANPSAEAMRAMVLLSRWQRRPSRIAADLRRHALEPLHDAVNRCGAEDASLEPDALATELHDELARVWSAWGLVLVRLTVETLELVDGADAPDRIRVLRAD